MKISFLDVTMTIFINTGGYNLDAASLSLLRDLESYIKPMWKYLMSVVFYDFTFVTLGLQMLCINDKLIVYNSKN
jgi:hypothetical protein